VDLLGKEPGLEACLELEADLAVLLTARALKRPPPRILGVIEDADAASLAGGVAAILTAVTRVSPEGPLRVRGAGASAKIVPSFMASGRRVGAASLDVKIDGAAYRARLSVTGTPAGSADVPWSRDRLRLMGDAPLDIPIVACACVTSAAELASLEVGDAWMLGPEPWAKTLRGHVALAAPDAEVGARAELLESGALVLRAGSTEVSAPTMSEQEEKDPILEAVGDVPVVVRVEVGSARMSAREWAGLGPGDVVALAHKLADPVTLRVGGVAVAEGELVDIEGEVGVRVLRRLGAERAP
jgi:type III secretion system YscQ/HrcQ family protein